MSTSMSDLDCYVIRAWSRSIQNWVKARAIPIPDTNPNWVSYKQYETLNGTVPRPQFEIINSVTQKVLPTGTIDWCKQGTPRRHRDVVFQIRSKHEISECDMGIQRSLLLPPEPETLKAAPALLDNADEEDTEGPPRNTEEVVKEPLLLEVVIKARKWFEDHQEGDIKINLFEGDEGDPTLDKITTAKEWFKDLDRYVRPHMQVKIPPSGYHAPKIAILDTGLDEDHPAIMACFENFFKLKSFTDGNTRDFHGHGTFIASLILKVAPQSHLYIAKVTERRQLPLKHDIAEAINWAIKQEVDIITMSFGMTKPDPDIKEAIHKAYGENIIIFAAASNEGGNQGVTYPARNPEVIPVFSTDGKGNRSDFNPNPIKSGSFAILGEGIESSWTTCNNPKTTVLTKFKSGTSYACPVAAGMASLMLDFVKLHGQPWYPELHSRSGIIKAFDLMEVKRDEYNYLCPWRKLFQEGASSDSILSKISEEVTS